MLRKLAKGGSTAAGSHARSGVPLSVIGPDVRIVGDIITQGEMQIDGQVDGDIACQTLVVGEGARITGEVTAETVRVHGELSGKIHGGTILIARSAKVVGDISHDSLEIEAGAQIEGHITRKGNAAAETQAAPLPFKKANGAAHPAADATAEAIPEGQTAH